jgi:signal transduction histidine kinase
VRIETDAEEADADVFRLRALLRDVVALTAIPAGWIGKEPDGVATGLADVLVELLRLDFAFVRLRDPGRAGAVDVTRGDAWKRFPEWLESHLAAGAQLPRKEIVADVGGGSEPCSGFAIPIGVDGEGGLVAAACERGDFPTEMDQLLLSLAANQAAIAFQSARLIHEQTAELRQSKAYLAELAEEQAALRRVATMVAEAAPATAVFDAVAAEMESLLGADGVTIGRYEHGAEVTVVAHRGSDAARVPPGSRCSYEGENVTSTVRRTERPARKDDYEGTRGAIGELAHSLGVRGTVGAPIVVDGRLWGVIVANWRGAESPPADTEKRIAEFTELVATAISNIQARSDLAASRARVVAASDNSRRQIERDLHDGAQQRLVQIVLNLQMAREAIGNEPEAVRALMAEALGHAEEATVELRELAHGILPPVLTHGGLGPAVRTLARRMPVPVEIDVDVGRLPAAVEATAYFVVAEALTNVAKHSEASHATVAARVEDGALRLEVRDDGAGGARPDGSGFIGLADRIAVFEGELEVESPAAGGTLVAATVPLPG